MMAKTHQQPKVPPTREGTDHVLHSRDGLLGNKKGQMLIHAAGTNRTSTRPHERSFTQEVELTSQILVPQLARPARSGFQGCGLRTDGVGAGDFLQWPAQRALYLRQMFPS